MGQVESSDPDDANCFRTCLRDKKYNSGKLPAAPLANKQQHLSPPPNLPSTIKSPERKRKEGLSVRMLTPTTQAAQTSIEERLELQMSRKVGGGADRSPSELAAENNEQGLKVDSQVEERVVLGLQSKFSSSRKTTIHKNRTSTRITAASEGVGSRSNWEKEGVSADETHNKSHAGSTDSARSRNVLLNKIEQIKQKYYEKQLEIEIYQNQDQYQPELQQKHSKGPIQVGDKINQQELQVKKIKQVKEIGSTRQKILEKLNKRKQKNLKKVRQSRSSGVNENSNSNEVTPTEDLEIFSRLAERASLEESLGDSPKGKKDLTESVQSNPVKKIDENLEERILFSGYSQQQTLHEIRECDEEQQDYKSKTESKAKASILSKSKPLSHRFSNKPSLAKQKAVESPNEPEQVKENSRVSKSRASAVDKAVEVSRSRLEVSGLAKGSNIYVF